MQIMLIKKKANKSKAHSSDNKIGSSGANAIFEALKSSTTIERIDFRSTQKRNRNKSTFTWILIQANSIGPDGVTELAHLIETSTSLKELSISCISIGLNFSFITIVEPTTLEMKVSNTWQRH